MRRIAIVGVCITACVSSARAETFAFPHTLEIAGRLVNTPLGSMEVPYQSSQSMGEIEITPGVSPPAEFNYAYQDDPSFAVALDSPRTQFAVLLTQGRGECDADANDPALWHLLMSYVPIAIIGDTQYLLPDDGLISFSRPHQDSQPLPVGSDDEERHGAPVVFLIESPITLWANGDINSGSYFTIDAASRIVIFEGEEVPAPGAAALALLAGTCAARRRRR